MPPKPKPRPRRKGSGSIFQRKDRPGTWLAEFWRSPDPATGKRTKWRASASTEAEARQLLQRAQVEEASGQLPAPSKLTLEQYLEHWLSNVAATRVRPQTLALYRSRLAKHVYPALGSMLLQKLTAAHLQRLYAALVRPRGQLAAASVAALHARLHKALSDAVRADLLSRNVVDLVDPPRQSQPKRLALSAEQARSLLASAQGDPLEALYVLALTTGARQGELLALGWDDIDLSRAELRIRRTLIWTPGGGWSLEATKTESSDRRIPLVPLALDALARHRERLTFARRWERFVDQGLIFSNALGNPVERTNLRGRSWAKLVKRAGLPPTRFHDLRHAAATFLLSEGVPVNVVQAVLGHSSATTTLNVYGHVLVGQTADAMKKLARLLEGG